MKVYVRKGRSDHVRWVSFNVQSSGISLDVLRAHGYTLDGNQAVLVVRPHDDNDEIIEALQRAYDDLATITAEPLEYA